MKIAERHILFDVSQDKSCSVLSANSHPVTLNHPDDQRTKIKHSDVLTDDRQAIPMSKPGLEIMPRIWP